MGSFVSCYRIELFFTGSVATDSFLRGDISGHPIQIIKALLSWRERETTRIDRIDKTLGFYLL